MCDPGAPTFSTRKASELLGCGHRAETKGGCWGQGLGAGWVKGFLRTQCQFGRMDGFRTDGGGLGSSQRGGIINALRKTAEMVNFLFLCVYFTTIEEDGITCLTLF